ncbi:Alpha-mannosidase 2 [Aphelenchoides besseyi]|nr:Alpha-mannosidase 2 [Aphelenchoides besseyi]
MSKWTKPLFIFITVFLLVYVVLLQNAEIPTFSVLPSFSRLNTFDILHLENPNNSDNEILLFDHPKAILSKMANFARQECHDFAQEYTDIRVDGEKVLFEEDYTIPQKSKDHLNVYLVFHSHIDPGWLRTFDEYYVEKVETIINNAVNFLSDHADSRFIWSEMSYLELWYRKANSEMRKKLLAILSSGQLELTSGGWVMTDEATPYFWATIDNIVEGQQFVREELNVTVKNSWSVDPFGHGAMTPYLLSLSGVNNLVVGRLNKHVKEKLIKQSALLFSWAQPWNTGAEGNLPLISSLPRTYYTTSDACGPDTSVCCQFEFGNARSLCGERANINHTTLSKYAKMLTEQYKKLKTYYPSNHLLIAIGDDFFFASKNDFNEMYNNYKLLIDHINGNEDFQMKASDHFLNIIKFSTLSDYFDAIKADRQNFSVLRGDFFPYTENRDGSHPYWTGFYVHRPDFKRLERITQGKLRRLDILRVLSDNASKFESLQMHRRNLALAQHHDAITGTSKPHVMADYKKRLIDAGIHLRQLESDIWGNMNYVNFHNDGEQLKFDNATNIHNLTIFNQRTTSELQRISIFVNTKNLLVNYANGTEVEAELFPYVDLETWKQRENTFELIFYCAVPALGTVDVTIRTVDKTSLTTVVAPIETTNNSIVSEEDLNAATSNNFVADLGSFSLIFDDNGMLKSFKRADNAEEYKLRQSYGYYKDAGGAYVFAPNDNLHSAVVKPDNTDPLFLIGPKTVRIYSKLQFVDPNKYVLYQFIEIPKTRLDTSIEVRVELISSPLPLDGHTLSMNLETSIENEDILWTDINGLYLTKRQTSDDITTAGNFYPAASSALIEDHADRVTVLFGQPTAATTSRRGNLEFFVDRNLYNSDGKGLDYGDPATNETTHLHYRILLEKRDIAHAHQTIYLSRHAHESLEELLHPSSIHESKTVRTFKPIEWPCDIQLINLRHLSSKSNSTLLTLRKLEFDCTTVGGSCPKTRINTTDPWKTNVLHFIDG